MPVGAFYGSLAAAASVIVGLLSAFLVNSLVGIHQDRRQLSRELQQTKDELRVRYAERDEYQERVDEIEAAWWDRDVEAAHDNVDEFLSERVTADDFNDPPETVDTRRIAEEFANHLGEDSADDLTEAQMDVLRNRRDGVLGELATATAELNVPDITMMDDHNLAPPVGDTDTTFEGMLNRFRDRYEIERLLPVTRNALKAQYDQWRKENNQPDYVSRDRSDPLLSQLENIPDIHNRGPATGGRSGTEKQVRNRNRTRLTQTKAKIDELERRERTLQTRLQSLSLEPVQEMLRSSAIAIVLTVVVPLLAYLCYELDFVLIRGSAWIVPVSVFVTWIAGLLYVLLEFRDRIYNNGSGTRWLSRLRELVRRGHDRSNTSADDIPNNENREVETEATAADQDEETVETESGAE